MKKNYFNCYAFLLCLTVSLIILPGCNNNNEPVYEQKGEEEHDEYDGPEKAAEFEFNRTKDPATGTVPRNKMWDAVLVTDALKNTTNYSTSSSNSLPPLTWTERGSVSDAAGPFGNQRPGNGVTSGRMRAVWVDKADPTGKVVWIGGVDGGIWKTEDVTVANPSWILINDFLSNLAVTSICQDPTNTNTMYFSTGEAFLNGGAVNGNGVFKSIDHGVTWTLLPSSSAFTRCSKILCDATGKVYVSTIGISIAAGLQRSSNGGSTWTSINPFTTTSRIVDFEISSTGAMHVSAGLFSAAGVGGYKYSTDPAAATPVWLTPTTPFTFPSGGSSRTELACVGNTVYASLGQANEKIESIAKSIDGGDNWTTVALTTTNISDLNGGGQAWYCQGLMADPSDPNTVIVGNLRLLKSTDGGATFSKISEWVGTTGQYVHADIHNITWVDNGNKLLIGTDGGLFYSTNKGTNFTDKNTGLRLKQFYGVSMHPTSLNYFLAGAQDNGTHQFNGPGLTSSIEVLGGDGGITAIDQDEPQFQTGAYVYANFRRTTNGGSTWSSSGSASTLGQFINPYDYDNTANKVYAGYAAGQYLRWENPQSGFSFTPVSIPLFGTALVASAKVSPYTANRVYFGLTNGKMIQVDNADQATPVAVDITPAGLTAGYVNSINTGTSDQNLTATLTNYGVSNIWNSTNGGTSWVACDGNLPDIPVYWSVYHPEDDLKAYIATETGVWSTDFINGTSTVWTPESTFPTVKTTMLEYRAVDRALAAATYGRGLWTAIIPNATCTPAAINAHPVNTTVCANTNASFSVTATGTPTLTYQWQISMTGAGGPWANLTNTAPYSNVTTANLIITGASVTMNSYQYRVVVTGNCVPLTATSNPAVLNVNTASSTPIVASPVTYCQGAPATTLTATGTNLLWYTVATGGTGTASAPTPNTSTPGSTVFYVSQTTINCESPRAQITVTVNPTPAVPTVVSPINYCQNASAVPLTATGSNLLWYTVPSGGSGSSTAPTPATTVVGTSLYYVSQTTGSCEGPRATITVNVTAIPTAPTVSSPVSYCQGITAAPLTAGGSNLLWYTTATGGTGSTNAPTPSTTATGSTTYYVSQATGCEGPRASIVVNITSSPSAPVVTSPVTYCQGAASSALAASGANLLWYTLPTGGTGSSTAPTPSTASVGTTNYYVTQTTGTCESPRALIGVTINSTPAAPSVTSPITYCQNSTTVPLTATGTNLLWYSGPSGGSGSTSAPTPSSATIGSTVYYVSQTTGSCEGPRASITVNVSVSSAAPTATTPVTYCQNSTAMALTATGSNLIWYTTSTGGTGSATAPIPSTTTVGTINYYVTQTTTCGESSRTTVVVNVAATPSAPAAITPVNYCQGSSATALSATGSNLLWYTTVTGGTGSASAPTPSTAVPATIIYYVSQKLGSCEGPRAAITVNVSAGPAITAQPLDITSCTTTATFNVTASGTNLTYQWQLSIDGGLSYNNIASATALSYTASGLTSAQANYKYRVVVSSASCSSVTSNSVTVQVGTAPVVVLSAAPIINFNPFTNGGLYATVTPAGTYTYQWKRNNIILPLVTSSSITKANGLVDDFGTYQVTVFNVATGCSGVSNTVAVTDLIGQRDKLILSPNPTQGIVRLSYYSSSTVAQGTMVNIYDSKGSKVMTKSFTVSGSYGFAELNLTSMNKGTYLVILRDASGKKIASERVIKY